MSHTNLTYYFSSDRTPVPPPILQSPESLEQLIERVRKGLSSPFSLPSSLSVGPSAAMFAVVVVVFPVRSFIRRRRRRRRFWSSSSMWCVIQMLRFSLLTHLFTHVLFRLTANFEAFLHPLPSVETDVLYGGAVYLFLLFSSPSLPPRDRCACLCALPCWLCPLPSPLSLSPPLDRVARRQSRPFFLAGYP